MTFRHTRLPKIAGRLIATRPARVHKVYAVLLGHADNDTMISILKKRTIEAETGLDRRTIMRATAELVALGLVRKVHRGPYAQAYVMATTTPFEVDDQGVGEHQPTLMLALPDPVDNPEKGGKRGVKEGSKRGHGCPQRGGTVAPPKELDPYELDSSSKHAREGGVGGASAVAAAAAGADASKNTSAGSSKLRAVGDVDQLEADLIDRLGDWWPRSRETVALAQQRIDAGASVEQLVDWLEERGMTANDPPALIRSILRNPVEQPPPRPKVTSLSKLPPWCGRCDPSTRYPLDENKYPDSTRPRCDCYTQVTPTALDRQRRMAEAIASGAQWTG